MNPGPYLICFGGVNISFHPASPKSLSVISMFVLGGAKGLNQVGHAPIPGPLASILNAPST